MSMKPQRRPSKIPPAKPKRKRCEQVVPDASVPHENNKRANLIGRPLPGRRGHPDRIIYYPPKQCGFIGRFIDPDGKRRCTLHSKALVKRYAKWAEKYDWINKKVSVKAGEIVEQMKPLQQNLNTAITLLNARITEDFDDAQIEKLGQILGDRAAVHMRTVKESRAELEQLQEKIDKLEWVRMPTPFVLMETDYEED